MSLAIKYKSYPLKNLQLTGYKMKLLNALFLILLSQGAMADEHITWDKSPIDITLEIGSERQIVFPETISVGIPQRLLSAFSTKSSVDNRLYIEAIKPLTKQRILVKGESSGINYVLYITAGDQLNSALEPVVVVHVAKKPEPSQVTGNGDVAASNSGLPSLTYRYLTQYALKQLHSPSRLVVNDARLRRVSVDHNPTRSLFKCDRTSLACISLISTPLVSFKSSKYYVTAFKLQNISEQSLDFDPKLVRSQVLALTTLHGRLLAKRFGSASETTLIVIHDRPLREILR